MSSGSRVRRDGTMPTSSNQRAYTPVYGSRGSASYVTGSHALKAGYTLIMGSYTQTSRRTGTGASPTRRAS